MKYIAVVILIIGIGVALIYYGISKRADGVDTSVFMPEKQIKIASPAFSDGERIPQKYTCEGENINPPLEFSNIPEETVSLVLFVDDPDAPGGIFDHWIVWNIDPKVTKIAEGALPAGANVGMNGFGGVNYQGPCPPSGTHRYYFRLFAIDTKINLANKSKRKEVEYAMLGRGVSKGQLMGTYTKEQ